MIRPTRASTTCGEPKAPKATSVDASSIDVYKRQLFAYAFEGILAFSTAPLKLAGLIGCLLFLAGVIFISFNLIQSIWVPGAVSSFDIIITRCV